MVTHLLRLSNDLFLPEYGCDLKEVIYEVRVFEISQLAGGLKMVEDVVFPEDKLEEDDTDWPYIRFIILKRMMQNRLHWHIGLGSDLVIAHYLEAFS
jgi:hypothetical protein